MLLAKWEYEDELRAIEDILGEGRALNTLEKRESVLRDGVKLKRSPHLGEDDHASLPNRSGSTQKKTSKK
jgi:hypothetical protein